MPGFIDDSWAAWIFAKGQIGIADSFDQLFGSVQQKKYHARGNERSPTQLSLFGLFG